MHAHCRQQRGGLTAVEVELICTLLDDSAAVVERHGRACRVDCGDDRGAVQLLALGRRTKSVSTRRRQSGGRAEEQWPDPSATDAHARQTDEQRQRLIALRFLTILPLLLPLLFPAPDLHDTLTLVAMADWAERVGLAGWLAELVC